MTALPLPRHEDWRWSDLTGVAAALAQAPANDAVADSGPYAIGTGPRWVFVDGRLVDGPAHAFARGHERQGHPLTDGGLAHGLALDLEPEHASAGLIEIVHFATGGAAHLAHRYALAEGAQASVVETYVQLGTAPAWANVAVDVDLAPGARLMRVVRRFETSGTATETTHVAVGAAASYTATTLLSGHAATRAEHVVTLAGAGAFASVDGAVLAAGAAKLEVFTRMLHAVPSTTSRQTWRAVARDTATASIAARVEIARGSVKSDANQSIKGLLFDRTATINAKPELEIFADDVKAAHGCAIGELDKAALFYMAARGLPPATARALLTQAFVAAGLATAGDPHSRAALEAGATAWLERS